MNSTESEVYIYLKQGVTYFCSHCSYSSDIMYAYRKQEFKMLLFMAILFHSENMDYS